MNKYLSLILFSLILVFFSGCSKDNDLNDSVWIHDPEDPELPSYSEWGYNTFGAYIDRVPFASLNYSGETPVKVIKTNHKLSFRFIGYTNNLTSKINSLIITIDAANIDDYFDLIVFNDSLINLSDSNMTVEVENELGYVPIEVINGGFLFKRAQNLIIDEDPIEVILSGEFAFKAIINGNPVTVSDGRFDFGVNEFNFYSY